LATSADPFLRRYRKSMIQPWLVWPVAQRRLIGGFYLYQLNPVLL
jgi:hypothetical protein